MPAYFVAELEITNPAGMGPYRAGRRHDHAIWRPLPDKGRRDRTDRRRTGAETGHHPRIRRQGGGEALVQFAGIPENPADAATRPAVPSSSRTSASQPIQTRRARPRTRGRARRSEAVGLWNRRAQSAAYGGASLARCGSDVHEVWLDLKDWRHRVPLI